MADLLQLAMWGLLGWALIIGFALWCGKRAPGRLNGHYPMPGTRVPDYVPAHWSETNQPED